MRTYKTTYTKHYYIEGERICSKIGGGFEWAHTPPTSPPIDFIVGDPYKCSIKLRDMVERNTHCAKYDGDMYIEPYLPPAHNNGNEYENLQYFYHPDHLGSASFVTNRGGGVVQHLQYLPYGELFVSQRNSEEFDSRYKFTAKELDNETSYTYFGARYYDSDLSVWLSVDPMSDKRRWISPYSYCQNNPIGRIDLTGALDDWYKTEDGTVVYDESIKSQSDLNTKGISGTYLSANKYDRSVVDAIGLDIMNSTGKCSELGWSKFISYVDNPDLGKDYFINAAMQNYNDNASGFMGYLSRNISGVTEATRLSQMTHDWADASGWTHGKNKMEHLIGMFLIADKFGESKARFIGYANEIRGLIINDRQSGQMWDAITGSNNTAFEWRDIMYNNEGISRWRSHRGIIDPVDAARQINTVNGVHMAPWNNFGTK